MAQQREDTVQQVLQSLCTEITDSDGLSEESRARLQQLRRDLGDNPALAKTLKDLYGFASWLGKQRKSPEAQKALLDAAARALPALRASLPDRVHAAAATLAETRPPVCRYTGAPKLRFGPATETPKQARTTRGGALARHNLNALLAKKSPAPNGGSPRVGHDDPTSSPRSRDITKVGRPRRESTRIGRPKARRAAPLVNDWETTAAS